MREDLTFDSGGERCAAWLYRPATAKPRVPVVVMAHGFSAVREQRLDAYAERFVAAGMAVLLFDYRHFGASGGEPRQLLDIDRQLADWKAAVAFARAQPGIDAARVAIAGSSFSGGHVHRIAAQDRSIAAVIAQVPFVDGFKNLPALGVVHPLRLALAGLRDTLHAVLGLPPYYIPAVGKAGDLAVMTTPQSQPGFEALTPPRSNWRNTVAARIALKIGLYRPGLDAKSIECPILYCIGERDDLTPARFAHATARTAVLAEVRSYDCGHFDLYVPPLFERAVADQASFLQRHLKP
jgi:fermentation-respiration switch protein FrsA (DUF1100 family)